ncbi:RNA polymerase sigma-E factor [Micromonospora sp. MW-13]|uniref:SigE family RNA polymerase sigma factor n=1 Tax=unclassified Micromonospora TaxID=2617518 RepID=UPI000ECDCCBC|nr:MULTISPECIES: SigE family RNA polymerase sigma factor [unclassified Micromonospora]MCX4472445.1 SigE family RNA polymerase sigma factor [Micromonospora sp. NBC_01655]RGC66670.1 RNA polymerase sigma-E factor [Micromonospora sp. MW-13]
MSRHEDDEQFRLFVQRQWGPLLRTAYLLTGDRGTAEDLAQSALEKTHRRWGRVLRRDAPEVYVRRVMVNTAISWRRRRRPLEVPLLTSDSAPTPDAYAQVEQRQLLLTALRRLPPRTQAVLVLRYFEDLSEADTARVLGCSIGSVKSQASRGLARLRVEFAPPAPQSPVRLEEELA